MAKEYEVGSDDLVLSGQNVDVKNIEITVAEAGASDAGELSRATVIDRHVVTDTSKHITTVTYVEHAVSGEANVIVAQPVKYAKGDKAVVAPCYITGEFRESSLITSVALEDSDKEALRVAGIILG